MGNLFHISKFNAYKLSNAQIIHTGIEEGKEIIKQEIGIDTEMETGEGKAEVLLPSDIFKAQNTKESIITYKTNN